MPDSDHSTSQATSQAKRLRERVRHAGEAAIDRLHDVEHATVDAYHALEDHSPRELLNDIKWLLQRFSAWLTPHIAQFKAWYLAQSLALRIVYGLTLVPVVAVLAFIGIVLIKFGGPLLLAAALVLKLAVVAIKTVMFIGYIGYKIVKTVLMWYITLSRWYLGGKAKKTRQTLAQCGGFKVQPESEAKRLSYQCQRKNLILNHEQHGQRVILFSYLRYALRGQLVLLRHLRRRWSHYLTLWRQSSRDLIKQELAPVGVSMFAPHKLGADIDADRILVPGDAELELIELKPDGRIQLHFLIRWVEWHFEWRKALKFLSVQREHHQAAWTLETEFQAEPARQTATA